jgi:hypothetical protein
MECTTHLKLIADLLLLSDSNSAAVADLQIQPCGMCLCWQNANVRCVLASQHTDMFAKVAVLFTKST